MAFEEREQLLERMRTLVARLEEAEQTLTAIRNGEIDAVVTSGPSGDAVYTLKGADQSYRLLVQQMAEGALTLARDGLILFANDQFAAMLGLPLERVIGARLQEFVVPEDHEVVDAILAPPDGSKAEVRLRKGSGHLPAYLSARLLRLDDIECVTLVATDLTEQKRFEEIAAAGKLALESEARLRTLGDNLPEGAIYRYCHAVDGTPWFEFISAGIERLTGVPAAEIMRDPATVDVTVLPEDFERLKALAAESREHLTRFEMEARHTHRVTGELRWSLLRSMPTRRPDGTTVWDGIQLDITDRKRAEEDLRVKADQLRQAQKMESIGVLAGGIAHDFNNLLTGVIGNASLVLDSMPADDPNREAIEAVMNSANRAADLTRQLLAYSGKGRFVVRSVNVTKAVRGMMSLLRGAVPANIAIDVDLEEAIPAVNADAGQMEQIVMNLVLNASEAIGDRPGRIGIRTETRNVDSAMIAQSRLEIPPGTYVCLEVSDSGAGMDEKTRSRIFEPFFTTKFQGRGLGLAAVHGIVRGHNGAIVVYSHPGTGSQFTVLLPAAAAVTLPKADTAAKAVDLRGHGTVLIVDDEETVRTVAKATLERFGYKTLLAKTGVEAVEIFQRLSDRVSVVLLDLTMPLMSAEETFAKLRAIRSDIPVLLSSGYNETEVVRRFGAGGVAGFVGKPYSAAGLVAKIKSACMES